MGKQYFVVGTDGLRHGPAELAALQQWANEGRIAPDTVIYDEHGTQYKAGDLLSFAFGTPSSYSNTPPPSPYLPGGANPPQPGQGPGQPGSGVPGPPVPGQVQPGPHWQPPNGSYIDPVSNSPGYDPLLYGGRGNYLGGCAPILAIIGLEMCCSLPAGLIGLGIAAAMLIHGSPYGKIMTWAAGICVCGQAAATVLWRLHGA